MSNPAKLATEAELVGEVDNDARFMENALDVKVTQNVSLAAVIEDLYSI